MVGGGCPPSVSVVFGGVPKSGVRAWVLLGLCGRGGRACLRAEVR